MSPCSAHWHLYPGSKRPQLWPIKQLSPPSEMAFYCTKTSDFWLDFVSITRRTNIGLIFFCTLGDLHLIHHRGSLIWWPSSGDRTAQHFFKVLVGIRISRTIAKPIINHYLEGHFTAVWRYIDQNMAKTHRKACLSILLRPKSNSTPRKNPFNNLFL